MTHLFSELTIREALNIDRTKETSAAVDKILSRIVGMGTSVDTPFLEMQEADYDKACLIAEHVLEEMEIN